MMRLLSGVLVAALSLGCCCPGVGSKSTGKSGTQQQIDDNDSKRSWPLYDPNEWIEIDGAAVRFYDATILSSEFRVNIEVKNTRKGSKFNYLPWRDGQCKAKMSASDDLGNKYDVFRNTPITRIGSVSIRFEDGIVNRQDMIWTEKIVLEAKEIYLSIELSPIDRPGYQNIRFDVSKVIDKRKDVEPIQPPAKKPSKK